jgi:hypothetical protein
MCIGQRIVLGSDGEEATHLQVVKDLLEAGIKPDPERPPQLLHGELHKFVAYPVVFTEFAG